MPNLAKVRDSAVRADSVYFAAYQASLDDLSDSDIPPGKIEEIATFVAESLTASFVNQHYIAYGSVEERLAERERAAAAYLDHLDEQEKAAYLAEQEIDRAA